MKTGTSDFSSGQAGFSLIETMVGMLIGMLGIIVMMQVYSVSEERKRTTTAGSDAQNGAIIALDTLQRDISRSGFGFANKNLLNCNLQLPNGAVIPLAPVIINPASTVIPVGDSNTDTILVSYGTADDQPDGYGIFSQSGQTYTIIGTGMMKQGDKVIASPLPCGAGTLILGSVQSVSGSSIALTTSATGSALYNLGASPKFLAYAIRSGNLTVCDYMSNNCGNNSASSLANPSIWRPIANGVISLRAQYSTAGQFNQTTPTSCAGWLTTLSARFALVARSNQFEKNENIEVTTSAPTWSGTAVSADNSTSVPIDLSVNSLADQTEWKRYRYKVFETTAPLRNVAWGINGC